ncbi:MAG TPA: caspase family protein [Hyphomicrobiaceae bacterium]|nr:caspase family protein [Hyphomicrobiaceae bacterium]
MRPSRRPGGLKGLRALRLAIAAMLVLLVGLETALAKRLALVVGIDRYDNLPAHQQLERAVGDARTIAKTLRDLQFDVIAAENTGREAFFAAWARFLASISPGDTAAIFFAGHGVEMRGANFLVPRDAPAAEKGEIVLRNGAIALATLLDELDERKAATALVILDACRNNPFSVSGRSVGGTRGLARVDERPGTLILYSAGAGQTALDRVPGSPGAPNSVFTHTLAPLLRTEGLTLLEVAIRTQRQVDALTRRADHMQTPAFYSQLLRDVYLAGPPKAATALSDADAKRKAEEAEFARRVEAEVKRRDEERRKTAEASKAEAPKPVAPPARASGSLKPDPFEPPVPGAADIAKALEIAEQVSSPLDKAGLLAAIAASYARAGRGAEARSVVGLALDLVRPEMQKSEGVSPQVSAVIGAMARVGLTGRAKELALNGIKDAGARESAIARMVVVLAGVGETDEAAKLLALVKSDSNRIWSLTGLAIALHKNGESNESARLIAEATSLHRAMTSSTAPYYTQTIAAALVRTERAREAIEVTRAIGSHAARRYASQSLGRDLVKLGMRAEAVAAFELAIAAARTDSGSFLAEHIAEIAVAAARSGLEPEARRMLAEAETLARGLSDPFFRASANFRIAGAKAALGHFEEAIALAKSVDRSILQGLAFGDIARALTSAGRTDQALQLVMLVQDAKASEGVLRSVVYALLQSF